jgi:hypothetical protein
MALSVCPKCDSHAFETKVNEPHDSNFKLLFVQCRQCGTVVGVLDYYNIGHFVVQQNAALKAIAAQLGVHVTLD